MLFLVTVTRYTIELSEKKKQKKKTKNEKLSKTRGGDSTRIDLFKNIQLRLTTSRQWLLDGA